MLGLEFQEVTTISVVKKNMWYKTSKKTGKNIKTNWFEIVPENIWRHKSLDLEVKKISELKKSNSHFVFVVVKNNKVLEKFFDKLEDALEEAERKAHDKNNPQKKYKN